ncbi:50S ribosomal protein L6 [Aliifodinibius sp. S!AR15-10]|uniref:50S ribosomal protein L6 n=1 Tax=Aliifodinibius sp. S!AR15-10 TaxID=2950437 RepID=UPI002859E534|nr:50S ribosomal protein L6 [Aliifodinibius sp. S!AR15-10]MDR8394513.1 50S ribosomal protein L6 [Aliifodinibius sp. S!AR15-10]
MSRIGQQPISLQDNVEFSIDADNVVTIKGKKGSDSVKVDPSITVEKQDGEIVLTRNSEVKEVRSLHGLYRSLIANMVTGVTDGYQKKLEIIGVGYRAAFNGGVLELNLGFSHPIYFVPPDGIDIEVDTKSKKNPLIIVSGINKELVGQVSAKIRSLRPPEPYKGKGVRYEDEWVRRKAGKSAAKGA